jgi:hypothetical protein
VPGTLDIVPGFLDGYIKRISAFFILSFSYRHGKALLGFAGVAD